MFVDGDLIRKGAALSAVQNEEIR